MERVLLASNTGTGETNSRSNQARPLIHPFLSTSGAGSPSAQPDQPARPLSLNRPETRRVHLDDSKEVPTRPIAQDGADPTDQPSVLHRGHGGQTRESPSDRVFPGASSTLRTLQTVTKLPARDGPNDLWASVLASDAFPNSREDGSPNGSPSRRRANEGISGVDEVIARG